MLFDHILQTIGRTPAVRLARLAPPGIDLYGKLEAFNPMGSVKDRMAQAVIEDARATGALQPGQTVVEATSGNTGIGLAMVCARLGHPLVIVMAENFSVERRRLMRFLGARVVLTPAVLKGSGMLAKAQELASTHGWFLPRQFDNEVNARVHERTTAAEILADFADAPPTHWVTGSGTGGTLLGVGRALRRHWPDLQIVVCEPENAPMLASGEPMPHGHGAGVPPSHPRFRPHPMQGWSPDFIPSLVQRARAEGLIDQVQPVAGREAMATARALARQEGILAGISGGATVAGALRLARQLPRGSRLLAMLPDTGERYLSTPLFDDVQAEMDEAEWEVSRSTPLARFDAPAAAPAPAAPAPAAVPAPAPQASAAAQAKLDAIVTDPARPVTMLSLEWCDFCWVMRRFFDRIGVPLHSIDLDTPAMTADAPDLRAALQARTGQVSLPQIFIGGQWVGGCMASIAAWEDGQLQARLADQGLAADGCDDVDPRAMLPAWLQPRRAA